MGVDVIDLVEHSLVGIYVIQDDRFVYVNPAMEKILEFPPSELISSPVLDFVVPEDRELVRENLRKRIEGAAGVVQYSLRMTRREVLDELRQMEGDAAVKRQRRDLAAATARKGAIQ